MGEFSSFSYLALNHLSSDDVAAVDPISYGNPFKKYSRYLNIDTFTMAKYFVTV